MKIVKITTFSNMINWTSPRNVFHRQWFIVRYKLIPSPLYHVQPSQLSPHNGSPVVRRMCLGIFFVDVFIYNQSPFRPGFFFFKVDERYLRIMTCGAKAYKKFNFFLKKSVNTMALHLASLYEIFCARGEFSRVNFTSVII